MKQLNIRIQEQFLEEKFINIDNQIINEKLECDVLKQVAKQLIGQIKTQNANIKTEKEKYQKEYNTDYWPGLNKSKNMAFNAIFGDPWRGQRIEWSKVTDKDVTVYEPENIDKKLESKIKKIIDGKEEGLIIIQNPENSKFLYVIFMYGNVITLEGTTDARAYKNFSGEKQGRYTGSGWHPKFIDLSKKDKLELIKNKRIYYIDTTGKMAKWNKIHNDRDEQKRGMIPLDPYLVKQIAENNVSRYKKIVAQMKAKRENSDELLDKCNIVIQKIANMAIEIAKDAVAQADMISPIAQLSSCIYDKRQWNEPNRYRKQGYYSGINGLLPMISKYTEARAKTAQGSYADMYKTDMDNAKKAIEETLNKIKYLASKYNIDLGI